MPNAVKFRNWLCTVEFAKYSNGRTAIRLLNAESVDDDGFVYPPRSMAIATATVNIPDYTDLGKDDVIIKDYSENDGMLSSLINAGIIARPHDRFWTGFVEVYICRLLVKPA